MRAVSILADGPNTKAYLDVFSAKLGTALYREHVGAPLPMDGGVQSLWFLNAGLAQQTFDSVVRIMPMFSTSSRAASPSRSSSATASTVT